MEKNLNIKMNNNYCHIGLGKCGTTFLQHKIFPSITKALNLKYIYPNIFKKLDSIFNLKKIRVSLPDLKKIRELETEYNQIKY